jgi:hypothetical protein
MAQLYILPFYNNQLLVTKVSDSSDAKANDSLRLISIALPSSPIKDAVRDELKKEPYKITVDTDRVNECGEILSSRFAVYKLSEKPNGGVLYDLESKKVLFESNSRNIFNSGDEKLVKIIQDCKDNAKNPPSDDKTTTTTIRYHREPFFRPSLGLFGPYGFWPFSPTVRVTTPYSSPIVRIPFFSLPRPEFGFVPAVVPTFNQPVLSPFMGNPFPRRVSEPSPMNRHLFDEKVRPVHMRSKRLGMNGGYYEKYLKYKNKYLELKNQLENQV